MTKFKGTQGQWKLDADDKLSIHTTKKIYANIVCLAPEGLESMRYWKANAQLIASAPELLENANMHIDALDLTNVEFYEKYGFNVSELIPKTRELIKKSTE